MPTFISAIDPIDINNSRSINRPEGTSAGHRIIALIFAAFSDATITPPAGWTEITEIASDPGTSFAREIRVYSRIVQSGDPSADTWAISGQAGGNNTGGIILAAYSDADTIEDADFSAPGGSSTSIVAPSITTAGASRTLVGLFSAYGTYTVSADGMTSRSQGQPWATGITVALLDETVSGAGATGTRSATLSGSGDHRYGALIALAGGSPPAGDPPQGTVTIGTIAPSSDGATVPFSYDDDDETGFEYRLDGGSWEDAGTESPLILSGLDPETEYEIEIRAVNGSGAGAASDPEVFETLAAPVLGVRVQLHSGATPLANVTDIMARWWDSATPGSGAPVFTSNSASTDGDGWLELDIDSVTSLDVDDYGFLILYKADTSPEDDAIFAGRLQVEDIA